MRFTDRRIWPVAMLAVALLVPSMVATTANTQAPAFTDRVEWPAETLNSLGYVHSVEYGIDDLDGDGHLDIVFGGGCNSYKGILWGDGDGAWTSDVLQPEWGYCWFGANTVDMDGDGDLDIVALDRCSQSGSAIYLNEGNRVFSQMAGGPSCIYDLGDYEGDGDIDLLHNGFFTLNDGSGAFSGHINVGVSNYGQEVTLGDMNGDGLLDVVAPFRACCGTWHNKMALSNGDGTYHQIIVGFGGNTGAVADLDSDGDLDFVSTSAPQYGTTVWFNDGEGAFEEMQNLDTSGLGEIVADLNGDGHPDILTGAQQNSIFLNDGTGHFTKAGDAVGDDAPHAVDINGDGLMDIVGVRGIRYQAIDTDGDGTPDEFDDDDDNDGVPDDEDAFPLDASEHSDNDGDGIGDNADPDDDNDGTLDGDDAFPFDPTETSDNDSDGIGDNADPDDDNDGVTDGDDAFPFDGTEWGDNDSDGIGDNADPDDDNDGIEDDLDPDSDGDGNIDCTPSLDDIDCLLATVTAAIGVFIEY